MAEADSGGERSESATSKRIEQAKEKGQVPRSKELATVLLLAVSAMMLMMYGPAIGTILGDIMAQQFTLKRDDIFDINKLIANALSNISSIIIPLLIILVVLWIAALFGSSILGGIHLSSEAMMPKLSKLNPVSGLKRMFGKQSLIELFKSILKVTLVCGVAYFLIKSNITDFQQITVEPYPFNFYHANQLLLKFILIICCSLILVVGIDVPFQLWQHNEQLKMTKQEVKDEYRDSEGRPEVKGRIRQLQREMANRRMMAAVPQADVIVTNPEHYSVALRYHTDLDAAPVVVAKGVDELALKIREIANAHEIPIMVTPPLTRALYYSTELEQAIPDGLFAAVAQVLAYIFQMKQYKKGKGRRPSEVKSDKLEIPEEYQHD